MTNVLVKDFLSSATYPKRRTGGKKYPEGPAKVDLNSADWRQNLITLEANKIIKLDAKEEVERRREQAREERASKLKQKEEDKLKRQSVKKAKTEEKYRKDAERKARIEEKKC